MRSESARLLVLLACGASPAAPQPVLVERVLAAVDGQPVLLSEARAVAVLKDLPQAAAVEALVDELLMRREAARLPEAALDAAEESRAEADLRSRWPAAAGPAPLAALAAIARRQALVLRYVEIRFRPQLRVDDAELREAWQARQAGGPSAEPTPQESERLRAELVDAALSRRIEAWVAELRAGAAIRYNEPAAGPR
jgi:hypothetical protein